jgi:catechol 2,3-dioxygenase-like lactoylglutathione lyase family enzyme
MLDHISLLVTDYQRSKAFYEKVLVALGATLVVEVSAEQTGDRAYAGYGTHGKPSFWISTDPSAEHGRVHVAFIAPDRTAVDAFHRAALAAGGQDNGAPGLRLHYYANYYGAFVLDPDGHNVEAVCHQPVGP